MSTRRSEAMTPLCHPSTVLDPCTVDTEWVGVFCWQHVPFLISSSNHFGKMIHDRTMHQWKPKCLVIGWADHVNRAFAGRSSLLVSIWNRAGYALPASFWTWGHRAHDYHDLGYRIWIHYMWESGCIRQSFPEECSQEAGWVGGGVDEWWTRGVYYEDWIIAMELETSCDRWSGTWSPSNDNSLLNPSSDLRSREPCDINLSAGPKA